MISGTPFVKDQDVDGAGTCYFAGRKGHDRGTGGDPD